MNKIVRIVLALYKTIRLILKNQPIQPPAERYPNLKQWVADGLGLVDAALLAANQAGLSRAEREALRLTIDRRDVSAEVILAAVRYHMTIEYPSLLQAQITHNLTTLYAINIDDQYRVHLLAQAEALPASVRLAVGTLRDHLNNIPSSNNA